VSKFLKILFSFVCLVALLILPSINRAQAYSPIVSSCNSVLIGGSAWFDIWSDLVQQLFEIREDHLVVDGAAARLRAMNNENSEVTFQIKKRDGTRVAAGTATVTPEASWVYADLDNQDLPRGVYLLQIGTYTGDAVWNYTTEGNCIADSYAIRDGQSQDFDMGFAVYAYDGSANNGNPPPDNQPADPGSGSQPGSGDQVSPDNPPGYSGPSNGTISGGSNQSSGSTSSTSGKTSVKSKISATATWTPPSKEDILKMTYGDRGNSGGLLSGGWPILVGLILLGILGLGFVVVVIIVIIIIIARRKKSQTPPNQTGANTSK